MTDTSHTEEDTAAPSPDAQAVEAAGESAAAARLREHDIWVAGTEEPEWIAHATDEGAQEMLPRDLDPALAVQRGVVVDDDYVEDETIVDDERQIINMGPQHPATHGVLRLHMELEGETIRRVKPIIGYLHTGMEKTAETLPYMAGGTNVTRMDYLSPLNNELCYSLAVEQLLDVDIPPRAQAIRVLMTELNRISSHLIWLATFGMDIGALSMMIYGFREREPLKALDGPAQRRPAEQGPGHIAKLGQLPGLHRVQSEIRGPGASRSQSAMLNGSPAAKFRLVSAPRSSQSSTPSKSSARPSLPATQSVPGSMSVRVAWLRPL